MPLLYSEWQLQRDAGEREIYLHGKLVNAGVLSNSVQLSPSRFEGQKLSSHLAVPLEEEEDLGAFVDALEDDLFPEKDVAAAREGPASSAPVQGPTVDTSL